jgi:hypothetical protein
MEPNQVPSFPAEGAAVPAAQPAPLPVPQPIFEPVPESMPSQARTEEYVVPAPEAQVPVGVTSTAAGSSLNGPFPDELRGWNWGAFLLNWIWAIAHGTWIGLLIFLPVANVVMPFVLGAKGNEWAWQNRKFESVEHFKKVQRAWGIAGAIVFFVSAFVFVGLAVFVVMNADKAPTSNYNTSYSPQP